MTEGAVVDLEEFRALVDALPPGIAACAPGLDELYAYVGLPDSGSMQRSQVDDALYVRIRAAFTSGHQTVWHLCARLRGQLIAEHVLFAKPLAPYIDILERLRDAIRGPMSMEEIRGDWGAAVAAARDHVAMTGRWVDPARMYIREFATARRAKALRDGGFEVSLESGAIRLTVDGESKLIERIERLVGDIGGLNVARRIFVALQPLYDSVQERYHLIPRPNMSGGGSPQTPWGYLLQIAVKHLKGRKRHIEPDAQWRLLVQLVTDWAAIIDVQPYSPSAYATYDATRLIGQLQQLALYDTLFRIPQIRPSDVLRIGRGMLSFTDNLEVTPDGWSIEQAFQVIGYLLDPARNRRGPVIVAEADIRRALPSIAPAALRQLLDQVLSHPFGGANQRFTRPFDVPTAQDREIGLTFGEKPLLKLSGRRYVLIDRSVCAGACLEALLTALRAWDKRLDDKVGVAVECFIKAELAARGIVVHSGQYKAQRETGECDVVAETPETLFFLEIKKKALTRRARGGLDVEILLDLAASLLAALAQAGWHELRIEREGVLELCEEGGVDRVSLDGRTVDKVAVSLFDYGSFQDRINLKHFMEATLQASYSATDSRHAKRFAELNASLGEIREQLAIRYPGQREVRQPFFNCWFVSVPQLLVLLDEVADADEFRKAFWSVRFITTGSSDLYHDLSYAKQMRFAAAAAERESNGAAE